jgi:hypothetical protein
MSDIDLGQDDLYLLLDMMYERKYSRKSFLLNAEECWHKLFYIQRGLIRLFYIDVEGRAFNKAFFAEGQTIWPVAPRDRNDSVLFNIAAIEATTGLEFSFTDLYQLLQRLGKWEKFALPFAEILVE